MKFYDVSSENLSSFDLSVCNNQDAIRVYTDVNDPSTFITVLVVVETFNEKTEEIGKVLRHTEHYFSTKEFATVTMKQSLTLYAKRKVVAMFPNDYTEDDPKVHSYVSRLSYEGIKFVANNIKEFGEQFKSGRITMKIPKNRFHENKRN